MHIFIFFSILITLAAAFAYINVRSFKLPLGILFITMGTIISLILLVAGHLFPSFTQLIKQELASIDFSEFLLGILLSFLLFAGSLRLNMSHMMASAKSITVFATVGVLISTFLIGTLAFYILHLFNLNIPYINCLLFGALISPTDPVAILSILKEARISDSIKIKIEGESLFNDGIGIVVFVTIMQVAGSGIENLNVSSVIILFLREAVGGIIAGFIIGYIGYRLVRSIDHFQTEILITLAMVMGGYSLCHFLHVSGPLAMVVAGLITGNKSLDGGMSDITRDYTEKFWEITEDVLNAILFILIGLQLVIISFQFNLLIIGVIMAILLILVRYLSLLIPALSFFFKKDLKNKTLEIMTWGGLRGGISIALALSLPQSMYKDIFVPVTFIIVLFSIIVQGFSMKWFVKKIS
ncbi:MAG: sodium:proton antiporter [Chitinophagaceae bacterium]|nr:sodium:proton antiporter [Chitinophagaceae bacterium]MDB5222546.1 sodium:proton antiporter [Chitinophagaceae bacterium]